MFVRSIRATISDWKNLYFCVVLHCMIKTDCLVIDKDQIDLRVRNATRFNDVFYGRLFCKSPLDYYIAGF